MFRQCITDNRDTLISDYAKKQKQIEKGVKTVPGFYGIGGGN